MSRNIKTSVKALKSVPAAALPSVRERLLAAAMHLVKDQGIQGLGQARAAAAVGLRQNHCWL